MVRMISQIRRRGHDERGAVAIVVAILMLVLTTCAAIVVDLGNARDVRRQSQNAADSSALAAANVLYPPTNSCATGIMPCITDAVSAAKAFARDNFGVENAAWTSCAAAVADRLAYTPSGESTCISFDSATTPTQVRVYVPVRSVSTFFGGVTGKSTIPVGSLAQAKLGLVVKCSLCFLGSVDAGNGDFSVTGGAIAVNGSVTAGPNSDWISAMNGVTGTVSGGNFTPAATLIPAFGDPFAAFPLPLNTSALSAKSDPCTDGPGIYGNVDLPNSACTLASGIYVINGTWGMKNNTKLNGTGVTLYAKAPSGYLDFKNGEVSISAMTTGVTAGFAIIYDRANANDISLQGNGGTGIHGKVYAVASKLDFNGNSCFGFSGGPIVTIGVVKANGNQSCIQVTNPDDTIVTRTAQYLNR